MKKILSCLFAIVMTACCFACDNSSQNGGKTEPDLSQFPLYVEPEQAEYKFDFDEMTAPYFKGNVIYNETVLLVEDKGAISGKLQYAPVKILSVRDYTWEKEYSASDFTVTGNVITAKKGSELPFLTAENLKGNDIPEPFREVSKVENVLTDYVRMGSAIYTESPLFYGHQISVSYVYDVSDLKTEEFASYAKSGFPKLKAKLKAGDDVKLAAIGDSVAEGCSSSGHFNHAPFMDNWVTQVADGLERKYDGNVTAENLAVGGMKSDWGAAAAQVNKIIAAEPDMVMIHFGINDNGASVTAGSYYDNMEAIVAGVLAELPDCEFMLIKAFPANPVSYDSKLFSQYWKKLDDLAAQKDCRSYTLDMYNPGLTLLNAKKYADVTGNGINHVNDYSSRLYTMNILSALIEY